MAMNYITKSRHGTIYYFRRRVPEHLRATVGKPFLVKSLGTTERRVAIVRARALAAQTDHIFRKIDMTNRPLRLDGHAIDFTFELDIPGLGKITIDAKPEEHEAVNSAIRTAIEAHGRTGSTPQAGATALSFDDAIVEYYEKAGIKPQSKATYRSKLNHARLFFGAATNIFSIDQAGMVRYCDHVFASIPNITSQGLYISTVSGFLNWHRVRVSGHSALSTKTLIPKKTTPDSDDRDPFSMHQLREIFMNAKRYLKTCPQKFWVSVAPAFLGCRIEELCQVHLGTDLIYDAEAAIWYFVFDGRPDNDGKSRKSMKKVSSWRRAPIHPALVHHGFIDFLKMQKRAGYTRPFEKEWKPREVDSELGPIIKWSHYVSRWGGRELTKLEAESTFKSEGLDLAYFHSMRHTFKAILGDAGVSSEISEALSGRRYGGQDAERYEKLKQNHVRLSKDGTEPGLVAMASLLDEVMCSSNVT